MTDLSKLRQQIDALDERLLELLNERALLAVQVGKSKKGGVKFSPAREAQILRRVAGLNKGPLPDGTIQAVFREIVGGCLSLQQRLRVGYLGPQGTYSEEAAKARFGAMAELVPLSSLDEIFRTAENGGLDAAIVPIENSTEGTVARALDLLLKTPLIICDELLLPVRHQLLGNGSSVDEIKEVIAHPQALAQCRQWLAANLPHAAQTPAASNGEAARLAAKRKDTAAVAGKNAVELYGLNTLARNIEDETSNTTRFVVLGNVTMAPTGQDKTSLACAAANTPGALVRLLKVFADHGVNMVKLESRPAPAAAWEYIFYMDIDGHKDDEPVAKALNELKKHAAFVKILGSYPKAL